MCGVPVVTWSLVGGAGRGDCWFLEQDSQRSQLLLYSSYHPPAADRLHKPDCSAGRPWPAGAWCCSAASAAVGAAACLGLPACRVRRSDDRISPFRLRPSCYFGPLPCRGLPRGRRGLRTVSLPILPSSCPLVCWQRRPLGPIVSGPSGCPLPWQPSWPLFLSLSPPLRPISTLTSI